MVKNFWEVKTCTNSYEEANLLSENIIKLGYASCAHIHKIESKYVWNDEFVENSEYLIVFKTTKKHKNECVRYIKQNHSYQLPEISCSKIQSTNEFFKWIKDNTN